MKNPQDPRHTKRQTLIQQLFKIEFHKQPITNEAKKVLAQREILDEAIKKAAPDYPINKINKVDLAILRLAMYELLIAKKIHQKL